MRIFKVISLADFVYGFLALAIGISVGVYWAATSIEVAVAQVPNATNEVTREDPEGPTEIETEDMDSEFRWLESDRKTKSANEVQMVREELLQLAETDPKAAMEYALKSLGGKHDPEDCAVEILAIWTKAAPLEAWKWTNENADHLLVFTFNSMAQEHPEIAMTCAKEYSAANIDHEFKPYLSYIKVMEGVMHTGNFEGAVALFDQQAIALSNENRLRAAQTIIESWAKFDPMAAMTWVDSIPEDSGINKDKAMKELVTIFASSRPEAAVDYALTLDSTHPSRDQLISNSIERLAFTNMNQALELAQTHANGAGFDSTLKHLASTPAVIRKGHDDAIALTNRIQDENFRYQAQSEILADWLLEDHETANEYVNSNPSWFTDKTLERAERLANDWHYSRNLPVRYGEKIY